MTSRGALLLAAALALHGCAGLQPDSQPHASAHPPALKGPRIAVDAARLGSDGAQACLHIEPRRSAPASAAAASGILEDDFAALREAARQQRITVTLRDSNPACAPHLRAGMPSKGHDVLTKTFTAESLPPAYQYLAGTVSTLTEKPPRGVLIDDPPAKRYLNAAGSPLTCDYDLMDVVEADGRRIPGESPRDIAVRAALNAALPHRGSPPQPVARIMHGAQSEYPAYLRTMAAQGHAETALLQLMKPESPITAIDHEGAVFRLSDIEDALNFYRCRGVPLPAEWDVAPR